MVTHLAGDRLNTKASQVRRVFARVTRRLAKGLEVAPSVLWSRDRKLLQVETVTVAYVSFLLAQTISAARRVARGRKLLSTKARAVSEAAADKLIEAPAVVREVFAETEESLYSSDRFGRFVMEALIGAAKNDHRAGNAASGRHDAPDRSLVEAIHDGPGPTWQRSWMANSLSFVSRAACARVAGSMT